MQSSRPISRRAVAGLVLAAALFALPLMGCSADDSDYFGAYESSWVRIPIAAGDGAYVGITVLAAHDGDTVVLESVDFDGREGEATIEPLVAVLRGEARLIGAVAESEVGATVDLATYRAAAGVRFSEGEGPVALAARISGTSPVHGFGSVIVRFQIEGSSALRVDRIPFRATVCTAATVEAAVDVCRPIEDRMATFGA